MLSVLAEYPLTKLDAAESLSINRIIALFFSLSCQVVQAKGAASNSSCPIWDFFGIQRSTTAGGTAQEL